MGLRPRTVTPAQCSEQGQPQQQARRQEKQAGSCDRFQPFLHREGRAVPTRGLLLEVHVSLPEMPGKGKLL